jgi:prevent-host-death family protein
MTRVIEWRPAMVVSETVSVAEFRAKCSDILDRVRRRKVERIFITSRGKVVGVLMPPEATGEQVRQLHGFMRGSVLIPVGTDLTAPLFAADHGEPYD